MRDAHSHGGHRLLDVPSANVNSSGVEVHRRRVGLWRVFGVATAFGIFSALLAYNYVSLFADRKQPFYILLALNGSYWYLWALLVPGMLWMARHYRFGRHTWRRAGAMHGLGVVGFTFTHAALFTLSRVVIMKLLAGRDVEWWPAFREQFFFNFDFEMMTYWATIGLSHALDYHRESQERALTAAQLRTRLAEAQLQALQRQLHPHFLFNTLHTISALMHRDIDAAEAMLTRLSDLLRLTLDRVGTQVVTLQAELDFVQKYLEIERTRFGDRLQVQFDVEPVTLDAAVPTFLLQPLVENALRHGIAPKVAGGRLEISARRDGDALRLRVRDNGYGIPADKVEALNTGVGVRNTRSRLAALYDTRHTFEFETPPGGGVAVNVVIPFTLQSDTAGPPMEIVA